MNPKNVIFLAYNDMELLDLSGAQTAIYEADRIQPGTYRTQVVGLDSNSVISEAGTCLLPTTSIDEVKRCHTLVIPGGRGARLDNWSETDLKRLKKLMSRSQRVVGICTGSFLLARVGLPAQTKVATHWASVDQLNADYPELVVDKDSLYVEDGKYWTSAGVTSGIDLTLRLIELDYGSLLATRVARQLVVYLKRSGSQQQFSEYLEIQEPKTNRIAELTSWIKSNLAEPISVSLLADRARISERHLHRLFLDETGLTPSGYIERTRLQAASHLLTTSNKELKQIGLSVGYETYDGFSRAFKKKYKTSPLMYRRAFGCTD